MKHSRNQVMSTQPFLLLMTFLLIHGLKFHWNYFSVSTSFSSMSFPFLSLFSTCWPNLLLRAIRVIVPISLFLQRGTRDQDDSFSNQLLFCWTLGCIHSSQNRQKPNVFFISLSLFLTCWHAHDKRDQNKRVWIAYHLTSHMPLSDVRTKELLHVYQLFIVTN